MHIRIQFPYNINGPSMYTLSMNIACRRFKKECILEFSYMNGLFMYTLSMNTACRRFKEECTLEFSSRMFS